MAQTAKNLRNTRGGRIKYAQYKVDASTLIVGDNALLNETLPADAVVLGAYVKNIDNDLTSGGSATLAVKVGGTTVQSATAMASIKGAIVGTHLTTLANVTSGTVYATVGTAVFTAGTLVIGVLYV